VRGEHGAEGLVGRRAQCAADEPPCRRARRSPGEPKASPVADVRRRPASGQRTVPLPSCQPVAPVSARVTYRSRVTSAATDEPRASRSAIAAATADPCRGCCDWPPRRGGTVRPRRSPRLTHSLGRRCARDHMLDRPRRVGIARPCPSGCRSASRPGRRLVEVGRHGGYGGSRRSRSHPEPAPG
jgi:hypothetical protein